MSFTAQDVKKLRDATGAGMMDCQKALRESGGNFDKAVAFLRENGVAVAAKKAGRIASEGIVDSYIHMGGKIGVLLEVNCESDFVAKSVPFKELCHDIAMHIAAFAPLYVGREEVPAGDLESEKQILRNQALKEGKPVAVVDKMVEGRVNKYYKDICLLDQDFAKDPSVTVSQLVQNAVAKIGEKIAVRRFVRWVMGEGLEKKSENLADEVQAQVDKMKK